MRYRRRGYSLLFLLAAMPLAVVAAVVTAQLTDRALRLQRMAARRAAHDVALRRLVDQVRADAGLAEQVAWQGPGASGELRFSMPGGQVVYAASTDSVVRHSSDGEIRSWRFPLGEVRFAVESRQVREPLVWVVYRARFEETKGLHRSRQVATAVPTERGAAP